MSNSDSQVEVTIVGKLDGSVSTTATAARAQMAALGNASQGLGTALQQEAVALTAQRQAVVGAGESIKQVGKKVAGTHGAVSTATREFRALFDELSSGRTRMTPGTLAIIAQRVFGLGGATLAATAGVAALVGGLGYLITKAEEAGIALNKAFNAAEVAGNINLTKNVLQSAEAALENVGNASKTDADKVISSFAQMRGMSVPEITALADVVGQYAAVTGQKVPEAAKLFQQAASGELLTVKDLTKIFPNLTQAQADQIEQAQQMQGANGAIASVLELMNYQLQAARDNYTSTNHSVGQAIMNWLAEGTAAEQGVSVKEYQNQVLADNTAKWDQNSAAVLKAIAGLRALGASPPPLKDAPKAIDLARDAIAQFDAAFSGSETQRYAGEAAIWEKYVQLAQQSNQDVTEIQREADQAQLREHQAAATAKAEADKRATEEARENAAQASSQFAEIQKSDLQTNLAILTQKLDAQKDELDQEVTEGKISASKKLQILQGLISDEYAAKIKELQDEQAMNADNVVDYAKYSDQIRELEAELATQLAQLKSQEASQNNSNLRGQVSAYKSMVNEVLSAESSLVRGIFSGRENLTQSIVSMASQAAESEIANDLKYYTMRLFYSQAELAAEKTTTQGGVLVHLLGEQQKTAATIASSQAQVGANAVANASMTASDASAASAQTGLSLGKLGAQIANDAKTAAANTYAAVSAIPVVGPVLAPAAAAAAFAGVMAFDSLTSLDVGTNQIPTDMPAMLHQGERVMPAADNAALMEALNSGGANENGTNLGAADDGGNGSMAIQIQSMTVNTGISGNPQTVGRTVVNAIAQEARNSNAKLISAVRGQ